MVSARVLDQAVALRVIGFVPGLIMAAMLAPNLRVCANFVTLPCTPLGRQIWNGR